jgi:hypothetical protein
MSYNKTDSPKNDEKERLCALLPLLNFAPTGARIQITPKTKDQILKENQKIAKKREKRRLENKTELKIVGPVVDDTQREYFIEQIIEDKYSLCDNRIPPKYITDCLAEKPLLWVVADVNPQREKVVFGFAFAVIRVLTENSNEFDMELICSPRNGMGMPLFKRVLTYAFEIQTEKLHVFTLEPLNRYVADLYQNAANEVMGRPLKYRKNDNDLKMSIVLNENKELHEFSFDDVISKDDFYFILENEERHIFYG